jgi:hypothetical protein
VGNPVQIGECAAQTSLTHHSLNNNNNSDIRFRNIVLISSSDSSAASEQMISSAINADTLNDISGSNNKIKFHVVRSSSGCHIDRDSSKQCHSLTVSHWFALSLSDALVTQTLPDTTQPGPTSGFSRFAGMYGLLGVGSRGDGEGGPFRNARNCSFITSSVELGLSQGGNWICDY